MPSGTTDPGQKPKLRLDKTSDGAITLLKLAGTIDEQFEGKKIASGIKGGTLILELADIERISSFGIREWVDFITAVSAKVQSLWFVECAPKVVDQFNMVANFGGSGSLLSFYAPYRCDYCDDDRRRLVQVAQDWEELKTGKLPERVCESCGNAEYFDEDPLTFFSFLQSHPPVPMPPDVAAFLATRLNYTADAGARKLKIEKAIDGRATYLKLSGDLDGSFPREKIADGAEGDVIFDLSGIGKIDPAGAAEWRQMMLQIAAPSERILIAGAPAAFVERLTKTEDLGQKGLILTFSMPYSCPTCRSTSAREIDVAQHWDVLKFATPPELKCPDCGSPTTCAASEALLAHLPSLPRPDIPDELKKQLKHFQEESLKKALAAKATNGAGGPLAMMMSPSGAHVMSGAQKRLLVDDGAGGRGHGRGPRRRGHPRQGHRAEPCRRRRRGGRKAGGVAADAAGVGRSDLLPRERSPALRRTLDAGRRQGRRLHRGRGGRHGRDRQPDRPVDPRSHLDRSGALAVRGVPQQGDRRSGEGDGVGRRRRAASAHATSRATRASGWPTRSARPRAGWRRSERNDLYWEKLQMRDGIRYKVSIRYAVPKANFEKLVEAYSTPETAMGAKAVSYFPLLAWRCDITEGAVITHVANDSNLRFAGIQEGDLVLAGMDRVVHDAHSWKRVLDEESAALARKGGTLVLKVKRGDAPAIDTRLRIARGGLASEDSSNRLHQTHERHSSSSSQKGKNQTGNIWDDNPEE